MIIYVVKKGDTIYSIANAFGVSAEKIISTNELKNPNDLVVGQTIVIISDYIKHKIQFGESLYSISRKYNVKLEDIINANPQITNFKNIKIGTEIVVPLNDEKLGTMRVNGYVLPGIKESVLIKTLPNLTYVSVFSYQVLRDGTLKGVNDDYIIKSALEYKVAPIMTITNIEEGASFSGDLFNSVVSDAELKETLINNIISTAKSKGYLGVDVDFEYLNPEDKNLYNNFIQTLSVRLKENGLILNTALAPKTSANQMGVLYEAHDYGWHGRYVDNVILMTYEWGYLYGPPMAVAPINSVKKVLNYAVSEIPSNKILMGVPNYGYDWNIPFKQGTAARVITNVEGVDIARNNNVAIDYNYLSQAPYFNYINGMQKHIVWFDDARSIQEKLKLVKDYNLGGVSYWNLNNYFPQNWLVQNALWNVEKMIQ